MARRHNTRQGCDKRLCVCSEMVTSYLSGTRSDALKDVRILDLGCGSRKLPGSIGIDFRRSGAANLLCDLEAQIWPVKDRSVDAIWSNQVMEHVSDVLLFLQNVHACVQPGGDVVLLVPHFTSQYAWSDPTHRRPFAILSMDYALTYLPDKFELVHRFFGVGAGQSGLKRRVLSALNRSVSTQVVFERWVTPLIAAGTIGFHLRTLGKRGE